jgi:hypothetical protein
MENDGWCVAVFKCTPDNVENVLVDFYEFVRDLQGVKDLHFLIRDRVEDEVVFSFRVLVELKDREVVKSKIGYKLGNLMPEGKFAIDPSIDNPLLKYVAWNYKERVNKHGQEKFEVFCSILNQLSRIVVDMVENKNFESAERAEITHLMCWILGCTEYGMLTTGHMEVGYYDRIKDEYHPYLKQGFSK